MRPEQIIAVSVQLEHGRGLHKWTAACCADRTPMLQQQFDSRWQPERKARPIHNQLFTNKTSTASGPALAAWAQQNLPQQGAASAAASVCAT